MKLLAIDVGNTHTVLGIYDGIKLLQHWRIQTDERRTTDEYGVLFRNLLSGPVAKDLGHAALSCVVPPMTATLVELCREQLDIDLLVVGPGIRSGMPILYDKPQEVGADRIVNSIAAYERRRSGVIVVDFGTATTFDCVSNRGEYLGGVIAPGIRLSADALFAKAARLPKTEIAKPPHVLGRNTVNAIQSGLIYGYVGLVDGIVRRLQDELGYPCAVLATGGEAALIHAESSTIEEVDEHLTLEGLRILFERQK
jgi:type III pantothenate kinase